MSPALYYHTLKYLKPVQFYGRVWFRCARPRPDLTAAPPRRSLRGAWTNPALRRPSLIGPERCRFLNEERDISAAAAWNDGMREKLWLYNLHYFDDLQARDCEKREEWQIALVERWMRENPPGTGIGWEPYPTSLRIVNWIKGTLRGMPLPHNAHHSLAVQARWLARRLEMHLLGNHLFANAKALVFAGLFFDGPEAARWLDKGLAILEQEIPEQILADGGHFERSPMYHALVLEDMLDLLNLTQAYPCGVLDRWRDLLGTWPKTIERMQAWLSVMSHPDGEISFFNDAAFGVAPEPEELHAYARRLGLSRAPAPAEGVTHLANSGYIRVQREEMAALLDVAPVGPDYLAGHAHADTLSFELSLHGRRVIVNSGTSRYGSGAERMRQRGTAAHNTVTLDEQDSSEVWGGFRVARRARPGGLDIERNGDVVRVRCSHDGYRRLRGRPIHEREWVFDRKNLLLADAVRGRFRRAVSRLYFAPGVVGSLEGEKCEIHEFLARDRKIHLRVESAEASIVGATYHPEFGMVIDNHCLEVGFIGDRCNVQLLWS